MRQNLAGFAKQVTPPSGANYWLQNVLKFDSNKTKNMTPNQRAWTDTQLAPIQKFRWSDFYWNKYNDRQVFIK